jgi:hypothetical protein
MLPYVKRLEGRMGPMADVEMREVEAEVQDDGLWLGDAIHFFLSAKRAGGRSERTLDDYRKKLELFQRWVADRYGNQRQTEELDAPYLYIGADEVEAWT